MLSLYALQSKRTLKSPQSPPELKKHLFDNESTRPYVEVEAEKMRIEPANIIRKARPTTSNLFKKEIMKNVLITDNYNQKIDEQNSGNPTVKIASILLQASTMKKP